LEKRVRIQNEERNFILHKAEKSCPCVHSQTGNLGRTLLIMPFFVAPTSFCMLYG